MSSIEDAHKYTEKLQERLNGAMVDTTMIYRALTTARADLAEALEALRAVDAWIAEDDISAAPLRPEGARAARAWVRAAVGNRINIVLSKHAKPEGGAT